MEKVIPIFRPYYDNQEEEAVARILRSRWTGLGSETEKFEHEFAKKLGVKHAIALNSCTSALHLAYLLHNIGPGDEVIVPTITFISTAHCVLHTGAKVVFVDVTTQTIM